MLGNEEREDARSRNCDSSVSTAAYQAGAAACRGIPHEATRSALPTTPSQAGNAITHQFQLYNMYDRKSLHLLRRRCEVAML